MEEIRIEARLRNNVLWHAIFDRFSSVAEFCRTYNFDQTHVGDLLNLKAPIKKRRGEYRQLCQKLSFICQIPCDKLFPDMLYRIEEPERVLEVSMLQLAYCGGAPQALPMPDQELEAKETLKQLEEAFLRLPPRQEKVIRLVLGMEDGQEHTFKEIGEILGISPGYANQLSRKAFRSLRRDRKFKKDFG